MKPFHWKGKDKPASLVSVMCLVVLFCPFSNTNAQQKHAVQIKTFDQSLAVYPNLEVSVNNSEYIRVNNKGIAYAELTDREIPVKTIQIKDEQLEAASWNYVRGTLEIMVRKKNYRLASVIIKNQQDEAVSNLKVTFKGKTTLIVTSDSKGQIQIPLGVNDAILVNQFSVNGYIMNSLSDSPGGKILVIAPLQTKTIKESLIANQNNLDFSLIDTIQSLPVFYKVIINYDLTKLSLTDHQRLNVKFNQLYERMQLQIVSQLRSQRIALLERISDSTFLPNDIKNIVEQARLENKLLGSQRGQFDQIVSVINKKLDTGIGNLSEADRKELLDQLTLLEDLLIEYESLFFKNQNDYRVLIRDIKDHFSEFKDLEEKLTSSERTRVEQENLYKQRLFIVSALVIVFALLILLFIFFSIISRRQKKALRKANAEIKQMNENLEVMISRRTKLLQSANHELDTFLYRASHNLRAPVRSIMGLCQLSTKLEEHEKEEVLERIYGTSQEMDQLLGKLSVISEINQPPTYFVSIKIAKLIEKIRGNYQSQIIERQIKFVVHCNDNLEFHSNPHLIESILSNLLENAFYFSTLKRDSPAEIELTFEVKDKKLVIVIRDNGIGINESVREKLYDMFFKGSELSIGNGLGLYIVKKAVKLLDGKIRLESTLGKFTEFIIMLPPKFKTQELPERLKLK